jgi:ectoine hydroxylase-related dioxygenase (phytanoyl-CoA dioxygenase family)
MPHPVPEIPSRGKQIGQCRPFIDYSMSCKMHHKVSTVFVEARIATPFTTDRPAMPNNHPAMPPLNDSTALIGDQAALAAAMDRDGYWFFRGVLDREALARLKTRYMAVLHEMGVVDADATDPIWNGASLDAFPEKIEPLHAARTWRNFVAEPAIHAFFTRLLGAPPFWIPSVEYRITPPKLHAVNDELTGRHQDGFANGGMRLMTCWVPINPIDASMGGLTMAQGLQHGGMLHDLNDVPRHRIPDGTIPDDVWHRSDYQPGDLVMFCPEIPHSGMVNHSRNFRLSMDVRVMRMDDAALPAVGNVVEITDDHVVVANHDGRDLQLVLDENTYCRGTSGARIPLPEMVARLQPGDPVIVPFVDDHAVLLRPQR